MAGLNIDIPDKYLEAFNVFKINNKNLIEATFEKGDQAATFQYILKDYFHCRECKDLLEKLKSN